MTTARVLEPEWLDELPHEDPRAMRSRRVRSLAARQAKSGS